MQLAYAFPANAAEFSADGKLYLLGGDFGVMGSATFPLTYPMVAFVGKLWILPQECQREHRLSVQLVGPTGEDLSPEAPMAFTPPGRAGHPERPVGYGFVLHLYNLTFPRPGEYAFRIRVDGREVGTAPIFLEQMPPAGRG